MRSLEFLIELYLVRQIPKDTKGNTWIGTDLKVFIGVGNLLNIYKNWNHSIVVININTMKTTFDYNFLFLSSFQSVWKQREAAIEKHHFVFSKACFFEQSLFAIKYLKEKSPLLYWYKPQPLWKTIFIQFFPVRRLWGKNESNDGS